MPRAKQNTTQAGSLSMHKEENNMNEVEQILDFVNDHYERFGAYPMEVQTDNAFYTFDQYWAILDAAE